MSISLSPDPSCTAKKKPLGYTKDSGLPQFSKAMMHWWCWHWPAGAARPAVYRLRETRAPFCDIVRPHVEAFLALAPSTKTPHPDGRGNWCQYEIALLRTFQSEMRIFWTPCRAWDEDDRWYLMYLLSELRCLPPLVYQSDLAARRAAYAERA